MLSASCNFYNAFKVEKDKKTVQPRHVIKEFEKLAQFSIVNSTETCDVIQNRRQDNRHKWQLEVNIEVRSIYQRQP